MTKLHPAIIEAAQAMGENLLHDNTTKEAIAAFLKHVGEME